jgi:hypothetical protein
MAWHRALVPSAAVPLKGGKLRVWPRVACLQDVPQDELLEAFAAAWVSQLQQRLP